ncbi:MAG: hypothetical protein CMR00_12550 [[Chlorobium] sp. 445]|nr:MAG: hypothetical protein CMR00_12550 [[Chlorobium] sp. 445]
MFLYKHHFLPIQLIQNQWVAYKLLQDLFHNLHSKEHAYQAENEYAVQRLDWRARKVSWLPWWWLQEQLQQTCLLFHKLIDTPAFHH